ncbi:hypothetical protein Dimus_016434 [Dionaea muscipula]
MNEMVDLWQVSEEGNPGIAELSRSSIKAGYNMSWQYFGSYLSEVPAEKKCDGLPGPYDDIGVTNQNVSYFIADGPPPHIVVDVEEGGEEGEVHCPPSTVVRRRRRATPTTEIREEIRRLASRSAAASRTRENMNEGDEKRCRIISIYLSSDY